MVALKFFKREDALCSFKREISALQQLNHPHVVSVKFADYSSGNSWLCRQVPVAGLEMARGTLADAIKSGGAFSAPTCAWLIHQLVDALAYCHRQGICHRDVKPCNLLVSQGYDLLLADFGLATHSVYSSVFCGTLSHVAPEVANCVILYDCKKADVWSAGVCYFNFLTGCHPYSRPTTSDWNFKQVCLGNWKTYWDRAVARDVPESARTVLETMLDTNPFRRPPADRVLGVLTANLQNVDWRGEVASRFT